MGSNDFTDGTVTFVSWVFRKPSKPTTVTMDVTNKTGEVLTLLGNIRSLDGQRTAEVNPALESLANRKADKAAQPETEAQQLKAQIEKLQAQLKKMEEPKKNVVRYLAKDGSIEASSEIFELFNTMGVGKFPNDLKVFFDENTGSYTLSGSPAAIKWASAMLDKFVGARPASPKMPKLPAVVK